MPCRRLVHGWINPYRFRAVIHGINISEYFMKRRSLSGFSRYPLLASLPGLLLLAGCVTAPEEMPTAAVSTGAPAVVEADPPAPEDYPVAPFEGDSLYGLLVAEIAGHRSHYHLALEKYLEVARETRDPGVVIRAARLAAHMGVAEAQLEMAGLRLEREPDDVEARHMAIDVLLTSGRLAEAIEHMEKIKEQGGTADFEELAYRASGLDADGLAALHAALEQMLIRYPDDGQLLFAAAALLQRLDRPDEALALLKRIPGEDVDTNRIILQATLLVDLARRKEALAFMGGRVAEAPDNDRLRLVYARLLFEEQDLTAAREQYEAALKRRTNDGDILFALALIALEMQDDEEAKRHLERMLRWNRRTGEAHFYLGGIAERRSDLVTALREYGKAGNGYEFMPAQARIAAILADDGRWQEAREHLRRKRSQVPERSHQLALLEARLLAEHGMKAEVFEFLDGVLLEDPDNTDLLYLRAMTGHQFGRLDLLERDLRRIIDLDPENADALNALGYTLTDQTDRHEEALVLIEKALAIKPDEAAFIDSMGWVQYRLRNYEQALVHLRRALELLPDEEVAAHLGEVLWVTGERDEARAVWSKALEMKPDSEILKNVIKRFQGR